MAPSIHKFSILGLLAADITFDSRAKRAFSAINEVCHLEVLCYELSLETSNPMPYPVHKITADGPIFRFIKLLVQGHIKVRGVRPNLVYAEGLLPLVAARIIKLVSGTKFVYDARELYLADEAGKSTYSLLHRVLEKLCISSADLIFSPNEERAAMMRRHYKLPLPAVQVLKNIPPEIKASTSPLEKSWRDHFSLSKTDRLIVYQGAIGKLRGLDKILDSIPYTPDQFHFLFIIPKASHEKFKATIPASVAKRVHVYPYLTPEQLRGLLSESDAGIVVYNLTGLNNKFCAPNKLYEYSQMKLPMLTSPQPLFLYVQRQYRTCEVIDESTWEKGDHKKIAEHLLNLLNRSSDQMNFKDFNQDNNWPDQKQQFLKNIHALLSISKKSQRPKASSNTQWERL